MGASDDGDDSKGIDGQGLGPLDAAQPMTEAMEAVAKLEAEVDMIIKSAADGGPEDSGTHGVTDGKRIEQLTKAAEGLMQSVQHVGTDADNEKDNPQEGDNKDELAKLQEAQAAGGFDLRGATDKKIPKPGPVVLNIMFVFSLA